MSATATVSASARRRNAQPLLVRRAAVLGAGTMGSRIAAHLANAGIPSLLLDLGPKNPGEKPLAQLGLEALARSKPAAFFEPARAALITPGTFDGDLPGIAGCDWVIEAVAENLEIKTGLLGRAAPHIAPQAVLTTNTSGLPIHRIAAALPANLRSRFFGAHFFNPPRYMKLLELIPAPETDADLIARFAAFAGRILGKQVVYANDTPNFIANRIGVNLTFTAANLMLDRGFTPGLSIEEVDALTGPALGFPRTGTFRLADLIGIDVLAHVARNFPEESTSGGFSRLLDEMLRRNWLGDKTGQGFYKKVRAADGREERFVLDPATMDYRPAQKPTLPALEMARNAESLGARLKVLLANDPARDRAAAFLWPLLATLWNYSADRIGEIAADAPSIDAALRAGFNWEMGPFELWDQAGVPATVERMRALNIPVSPRAELLLSDGRSSWYEDEGRSCFNPVTRALEPVARAEGEARLADFRREGKVVRANSGCSLIDLGDNIACIELHSFKNAIGGDVLAFISSTLDPGSDAVRDFAGFVISGDRDNFSVGANLMQLLLAAQEGEWDEVGGMIRLFQKMTALIKFCPRPVIAAPFGLTLGGGAEMCLHAARRQAHAETYMGLVEAGVGLIPAGGGTKESLLRAIDVASALAPPDPKDPPSRFAQSAELATALKNRLELIAMAKVSTSAVEARSLGLLTAADRISLNRNRLLLDAKAEVSAIARSGYTPPQPRCAIPAPGTAALGMMETGVFLMGEAGYASEHDQKVARRIAYVLAGGRVTPGTLVTEQYLLDLELEAFLSLCGEQKTQERIAYTLKTGKPLRN
ncbi:MAG TPA: 3-hydroxyacyl-CoA dehydrogenase NAD-binding domain-containing protein [Terracidiphilus sp.]|nr:3-hydroxyacyl-CoA dehydrogenase NAD-binding domain-containing protein [Terracidiphilus sp.]